MTYLMETTTEGRRLLEQERANPSLSRLRDSGLGPGMRAIDVGCGAGAQLPSMLELVGAAGTVTAIDPSVDRLELARQVTGAAPNLELLRGALPSTGLEGARFDFVWSQFVLEHLHDPVAAVAELARLSRPGGTVAVSEIDGVGLDAWPMPEVVARGVDRLLPMLSRTGFDIHMGRKVFALFRAAGLRDVRVHLSPLYVAAGPADDRLIEDWRQRFEALTPLAAPAFGGRAEWDAFRHGALEMFASPDTLKFAVLLVTTGRT